MKSSEVFFTGRDHKVVIHSANIFNTDVFLPYSRANMIHLFRNLNRGCMDVLFPKRFLYRYAEKELDLPPKFFYRGVSTKTSYIDFRMWGNLIMTTTEFGSEVKKIAKKVLRCIGEDAEKTLSLQNIISLYWINTIHGKLQDCGIDIKWPLQKKQVS